MIGVSASQRPPPPGRPSAIPMPEPLRSEELEELGLSHAKTSGRSPWESSGPEADLSDAELPAARDVPARPPRADDGPRRPPSLPGLPAIGTHPYGSGPAPSSRDGSAVSGGASRGDAGAAPKGGPLEFDLPAALGGGEAFSGDAGRDLPEPLAPPGHLHRAEVGDSPLDLPAALGGDDLPVALGGAATQQSFPSDARDARAARQEAGLPAAVEPAVGGALQDLFAVEAELPTVGAARGRPAGAGGAGGATPSDGELPSVLGADALPAVGGSLQGRFGQVDLPSLDRGGDSLPSTLGADALPTVAGPGQSRFGQVDLPTIDSGGSEGVLPPEVLGAEALPVSADSFPRPVAGGLPSNRVEEPRASFPAGGGGAPGDPRAFTLSDMPDPFGEPEVDDPFADPFAAEDTLELDLTAQPEPAAALNVGAGHEGGLGGGAGARSEPGALGSEVEEGPETRDVGGAALEVSRARPRRASRWMAPALAALLVVGAAALALKPDWGPFGAYAAWDWLHRQDHQRELTRQKRAVEAAFDSDSFAAVKPALERLELSRAAALRFRPLAAYSVYVHAVAAVRYGPWPEAEATARSNYERLGAEPQVDFPLAFAALQAVSTPLVEAPLLDSLRERPEAWALLGELLLTAGPPRSAEAVKLWLARVEKQPRSPQANYALARAQLQAGDYAAAETAARSALEAHSKHFGARVALLEAHRKLQSTRETADAGKTGQLVESVSAGLADAAPSEAARAWSVLGEMHLHYGRATQAQEAFEAALRVQRQAPRALTGLGETLFRAGRFSEALARFEAALKADPRSFEAGIGVAQARVVLEHLPEAIQQLEALGRPEHPKSLYWKARANHQLGEEEAALRGYRAAIEASTDAEFAIQAHLGLAELQTAMGDLSEAKKTLSRARRSLRPTGALFRAFGRLHLKEGAYQAALRSFDSGLRLDGQDTEVRFLRGVTLSRLGRFDEAQTEFRAVESSDKDFPGLAIERGRLFEDSGRLDKALAEFREALHKSPDSLDLKLRLGCTQVAAEVNRQTVELLQQVQAARPRQAEPLYCLARARMQHGNLSEASRLLERAIALDSSRAPYFLYLGWVSNRMGRPKKAELALDKAIALDASLAEAYWQRGVLRRKQGAARDAVDDLRHALALKPSLADAHAELALSFADLGQTRRAINLFAKALEAQPKNATWCFRLGKMTYSHRGFRRSRSLLERAIRLAEERAGEPGYEPPPWLWQAHYLMARGQRRSPSSAPHWEAYLKLSDEESPYRREARRALRAWNR